MDKFDRAMAAIALKHHSVITLDDVRAAGGNTHHAMARVKAGRWIELYEGVYRLAGAPWTYQGQVLAAVRAAGDGAAASFFCAARLLGFGFPRAAVELSVPRARFFRPRGVTVHTSRDLDRCTIVVVDGIPVTDAARTLLDLMSKLKLPKARRDAVEAARRADLVDWHDLVVCLAAHARKGRRGVSRLREVIAAGAVNDGITETDSELIALALLREWGFPEPVLQHRVYDADGELVAEMDFAYPDSKKNIEIDGSVHLQPEVKQKDEARDFVLREFYDWKVRRIWWEIPVHQPRKFIEIVRQTLG
ncbi:MAG: hypothetical protein QOI61_1807 [Actinomycetota bacterium]